MMIRTNVIFSIAIAIASCSDRVSLAQQVTVDLGGGRSIVVPVPDGFRALGGASPAFRSYSESFETPNNILLEIFLTDKDFSDIIAGHSGHRERELKIEDARAAFGVDLDAPAFDHAVSELRAMRDVSVMSDQEVNNFLAGVSSNLTGNVPKIGGTKFSGKILDKSDAVGVDICSTVENGSVSFRYCVAKVILHVLDRGVTISVGTSLHSRADIDWMNSTAIAWARQIIAANRK